MEVNIHKIHATYSPYRPWSTSTRLNLQRRTFRICLITKAHCLLFGRLPKSSFCYLNTRCLIMGSFINSDIDFFPITDPPRVEIKLGRNLDSNDIREGVDVYFTCDIRANPPPKSKFVTWLHNVSIKEKTAFYSDDIESSCLVCIR